MKTFHNCLDWSTYTSPFNTHLKRKQKQHCATLATHFSSALVKWPRDNRGFKQQRSVSVSAQKRSNPAQSSAGETPNLYWSATRSAKKPILTDHWGGLEMMMMMMIYFFELCLCTIIWIVYIYNNHNQIRAKTLGRGRSLSGLKVKKKKWGKNRLWKEYMWLVHDDMIISWNKNKECAAQAGYREQRGKVIGMKVVQTSWEW